MTAAHVHAQVPLEDPDSDSAPLVALDATAVHHRVDAVGTVLHWREWGQGQPLVLLHGGHGAWMHWARNITALSQRFRVLVPDLPGFGDSEDFALPAHDLRRQEALLQSLQDSLAQLLHGQPLYLAGFSFGGAMAALLATRMPAVQRLVLLGTGGHGGARREREPLLNWRVDDPQQRAAALRQNLQAFMLARAESVDALALAIHRQACEATRFRSKALSRAAALPQALQDYRQPILLVWGEDDVTAVPTDAAELLRQGRPERDWTIVPRAGHWVQYESAEAVNTLMLRWLQAG